MKIKVSFFLTFRELFDGKEREIELDEGANIRDLLNLLCDSPRHREKILDDFGEVRPHIKVLKNGRHIQFLGGMHTELREGDMVTMFPPIGGG